MQYRHVLRSRSDLSKQEEVQNKKGLIQTSEPHRKMQKGDKVMLRVDGEIRKWKWGVVSKTLGCLHYLIQVDSVLHDL